MRSLLPAIVLSSLSAAIITCGSSNRSGPTVVSTSPGQNGSSGTQNGNEQAVASRGARTRAGDTPPIAIAHGGALSRAAPVSDNKSGQDTKVLDAKIAGAEAKAKSKAASAEDKRAAAEAYLERANVYYSAGQPTLYKFALGDFRHVLRYDPENAEAREKMDTIISIYKQLGRPVPENGTEP